MSSPEFRQSSAPQDPETAFKLSLVDLIDRTHKLQRAASECATWAVTETVLPWGSAPVPFFSWESTLTAATAEMQANAEFINSSLVAMGGLEHFIDDPTTKIRRRIVLIEWQGLDPDDAENHLWRIRDMPHSTVSITPDLLDDLRNKFQSQA